MNINTYQFDVQRRKFDKLSDEFAVLMEIQKQKYLAYFAESCRLICSIFPSISDIGFNYGKGYYHNNNLGPLILNVRVTNPDGVSFTKYSIPYEEATEESSVFSIEDEDDMLNLISEEFVKEWFSISKGNYLSYFKESDSVVMSLI